MFVSHDLAGASHKLVEEDGFELVRLRPRKEADRAGAWAWQVDAAATLEAVGAGGQDFRSEPDWLIVDHYGLSAEWESVVAEGVGRVMAIDDLAERPHACALLLDQNREDRGDAQGVGRVLGGPGYALVRRAFRQARAFLRPREGDVRRLLVSFGGADPTQGTERTLEALRMLDTDRPDVEVVSGPANPRAEAIQRATAALEGVRFRRAVKDMAGLMASSDLAVGAAGSSTWERCCLGLPAVMIVTADNQSAVAGSAVRHGFGQVLGRHDEVDAEGLSVALRALIRDRSRLREMSLASMRLVDGDGASRVAAVLKDMTGSGAT